MKKFKIRLISLLLTIIMIFPNLITVMMPVVYAIENEISTVNNEVENYKGTEAKLSMITKNNKRTNQREDVSLNDKVIFMLEYSVSNVNNVKLKFNLHKCFSVTEDKIYGATLKQVNDIENNLKQYELEVPENNVTGVVNIEATLDSLIGAPEPGTATNAEFYVMQDDEELTQSNQIPLDLKYSVDVAYSTTNIVDKEEVSINEEVTYTANITKTSEDNDQIKLSNYEVVYSMPSVYEIEYESCFPESGVWNEDNKTVTWKWNTKEELEANLEYKVKVKYTSSFVNKLNSRFDMKYNISVGTNFEMNTTTSYDNGVIVGDAKTVLSSELIADKNVVEIKSDDSYNIVYPTVLYTATYTPTSEGAAKNGVLTITLPALEDINVKSITLNEGENIFKNEMLDKTTFPYKITLPKINGDILTEQVYKVELEYTKTCKDENDKRDIFFDFAFEDETGNNLKLTNKETITVIGNVLIPEELTSYFKIILNNELINDNNVLCMTNDSEYFTNIPDTWKLSFKATNGKEYILKGIHLEVEFPGLDLSNYKEELDGDFTNLQVDKDTGIIKAEYTEDYSTYQDGLEFGLYFLPYLAGVPYGIEITPKIKVTIDQIEDKNSVSNKEELYVIEDTLEMVKVSENFKDRITAHEYIADDGEQDMYDYRDFTLPIAENTFWYRGDEGVSVKDHIGIVKEYLKYCTDIKEYVFIGDIENSDARINSHYLTGNYYNSIEENTYLINNGIDDVYSSEMEFKQRDAEEFDGYNQVIHVKEWTAPNGKKESVTHSFLFHFQGWLEDGFTGKRSSFGYWNIYDLEDINLSIQKEVIETKRK